MECGRTNRNAAKQEAWNFSPEAQLPRVTSVRRTAERIELMKKQSSSATNDPPPPAEAGEMEDRKLVLALMSDDEDAWTYVVTELITPLVRANVKGIAEMLNKYSISVDALAGKVFLDLRKNDFIALRNFRYECRFSSFFYWRLYHAAQGLIREASKEFDFLLSDEVLDDAQTIQSDSLQFLQLKDEIESTNRLLARLWAQNPTYALVLLLRNDLGLSSKVVGSFLGKTMNNVDQINIRAQKAMRKFRCEEDA